MPHFSFLGYHRKLQGLSQSQLAEMAGLTQTAVSRAEQDFHRSTFADMLAYSKALGVTVDDLVPPLLRLEAVEVEVGEQRRACVIRFGKAQRPRSVQLLPAEGTTGARFTLRTMDVRREAPEVYGPSSVYPIPEPWAFWHWRALPLLPDGLPQVFVGISPE